MRVDARWKLCLIVVFRCLLTALAALLRVLAELGDLVGWVSHCASDALNMLVRNLGTTGPGASGGEITARSLNLRKTDEEMIRTQEYERLREAVTTIACRRASFLPTVFEVVSQKLQQTQVTEGGRDRTFRGEGVGDYSSSTQRGET